VVANLQKEKGVSMKRMLRIAVVILLLSAFAWFAPCFSRAQERVVSLNYSNFFPSSNRVSLYLKIGVKRWKRELAAG
jgi:hypothetical protein